MNGNAFDPANYPEGVPAALVSGDRWAFRFTDISGTYPPADYSLAVLFVRQDTAGTIHTFDASVVDGVYVIEAPGSETAAVLADEYFYRVEITRTADSETVTADRGYTTVRPALDADGDVRPYTLRVLQAIRATIEGTASKEQASYSVANRSLSRRSVEELIELEREYARKWADEKAQLDREAGRRAPSRRTLIQLDA